MTFEFHPDARTEFIDAVAYYENSSEGVGIRFSREVYATINRLMTNPSLWPSVTENTRRCLTRRFPYSVVYEIRETDVLIIAVAHFSRRPFYWSDRTL
ncbi:MAG TPA: type II toxin-antitoxin system RelE/ParE family toxin [Pyrinomonadaceae bacterium]|nr:type II toxin-antitoxin system RelE/ParE family toxin [Pyrinomonadaceae bacterium]HMP66157.1 type II toxin-antitoxin system RelE/ParE family toxin [Pyrinomonadaceae bacterium]